MLWVVLGLQAVVQNLLRTDTHTVGWIGHLMYFGVSVVHRAVLHPFRGAAHEDEVLLVFHRAIQNLPAIFQPLPQKSLLIVPRGRNANQQLVGVGFLGLFEKVVLLGLLESVNLITDGNVTVEGILAVWVCRQCADIKRAVRQSAGQAVLVVIVNHTDIPAVPGILAHAANIVI